MENLDFLLFQAVENIETLRAQFKSKFQQKIILTTDVTGSDILVAQTFRKSDSNYAKLTVNDYYFQSTKTDGSKVMNGYDKIKIVGRGGQGNK